jgi:hypothetical protein
MHTLTRLASFCLLASLAACQTMKMKVDPKLADDARMPVARKGIFRGGDLRFGEFRAAGVHRGWTHSSSTTVFQHTDTKSRQRFRFSFGANDVFTSQVNCETVYAESAIDYGRLRIDNGRHGLGCILEGANGPRGELVMVEHERHRPSGRMFLDGTAMDVIPRMRGEGARWDMVEPVGYELRVEGQVVGAVQTINGGAVWIEQSLPAELRQAAALAAATMLLYQPIDG